MKTFPHPALTDPEARQALAGACPPGENKPPPDTRQGPNHPSGNGI